MRMYPFPPLVNVSSKVAGPRQKFATGGWPILTLEKMLIFSKIGAYSLSKYDFTLFPKLGCMDYSSTVNRPKNFNLLCTKVT